MSQQINVIVDAKDKATGVFKEIEHGILSLGKAASRSKGEFEYFSSTIKRSESAVLSLGERIRSLDYGVHTLMGSMAAASKLFVLTTLQDFGRLNQSITSINEAGQELKRIFSSMPGKTFIQNIKETMGELVPFNEALQVLNNQLEKLRHDDEVFVKIFGELSGLENGKDLTPYLEAMIGTKVKRDQLLEKKTELENHLRKDISPIDRLLTQEELRKTENDLSSAMDLSIFEQLTNATINSANSLEINNLLLLEVARVLNSRQNTGVVATASNKDDGDIVDTVIDAAIGTVVSEALTKLITPQTAQNAATLVPIVATVAMTTGLPPLAIAAALVGGGYLLKKGYDHYQTKSNEKKEAKARVNYQDLEKEFKYFQTKESDAIKKVMLKIGYDESIGDDVLQAFTEDFYSEIQNNMKQVRKPLMENVAAEDIEALIYNRFREFEKEYHQNRLLTNINSNREVLSMLYELNGSHPQYGPLGSFNQVNIPQPAVNVKVFVDSKEIPVKLIEVDRRDLTISLGKQVEKESSRYGKALSLAY